MHIISMWIDRAYTTTLKRLAARFPAVLVTGARQVGKTSLLRHLYPDLTYVSFDHPAVAGQADSEPDQFLSSLKEPVIFDEVQYVPNLFRYLKVRIDQNRRPGRFFLTGSQTFALMQGVSESLAGRCGILEMHTLSFDEVRHHDAHFNETDYIVRGGFPELYSGPFPIPQDWFGAYLATYLERDVRQIKNIGNLRDFGRLMRAVAARSGQLLSYAELARDVGIAPNTARQWISILMASGQIYLLEPYYRNVGKRLIKTPKVYLMDTGLACYFVGLTSWKDLARSPLSGALWETFVVTEVLRHFHAQGLRPPLWFWRTASGDEVDLLVEKGGRFIAVECKLTENPRESDTKAIGALKEYYGEKSVEKGYLACRTPNPYPLKGNVQVIPGGSIVDKGLGSS